MMKTPSTHFMAALSAAIALPLGIATAEEDKNPLPPAPVEAPEKPPFYGSFSVGYESTYLFRGASFGDHAPWGSIDFGANLAENVTLDMGAWYINPTSEGFTDELDLYAWLSFPLGPLTASIGGTWYYFPEAGGDIFEPGLSLGYEFKYVDVKLAYFYDTNTSGSYLEGSLGKAIPVNDIMKINLGGGISYADNYYGISSFNHAFVKAGPSFALGKKAGLDIYIGGNFPLNDLADAGEDNIVHGGASITVSF